jgi:hypothetical protein
LQTQADRCHRDVEKHRYNVENAAKDVPRLLLTQLVNNKLIAEKESRRTAKDEARRLKAEAARQIEQIKEQTKRKEEALLTQQDESDCRAAPSIDLYAYSDSESGKENEYEANGDGYDDGSGFIVSEDDAHSYFNSAMTVNANGKRKR